MNTPNTDQLTEIVGEVIRLMDVDGYDLGSALWISYNRHQGSLNWDFYWKSVRPAIYALKGNNRSEKVLYTKPSTTHSSASHEALAKIEDRAIVLIFVP